MFLRQKRDALMCVDFQNAYEEAEYMVQCAIKQRDPNLEPECIYDFFIDVLGRELEAIYQSSIKAQNLDVLGLLCFPKEITEMLFKEKTSMSIAKANVASVPWEKRRLTQALTDIKQQGYCRPESGQDCNAIFFEELNFVAVQTGHHHMAAARAYHDLNAEIEVTKISIAPAFEKMRVSTSLTWTDLGGRRFASEKPEPRFAMMYELARRKNMLLEAKVKGYETFNSEELLRVPVTNVTQVRPIEDMAYISWWRRALLRMTGFYVRDGMLFEDDKYQ